MANILLNVFLFVFCFAIFCAGTTVAIEQNAENVVVECGTNVEEQYHAYLEEHGEATAKTSCSSIRWYNDGSDDIPTSACNYNVRVNFIASDDCGAYAQTSGTFTIQDTTAPVVVTHPTDVALLCDSNTDNEINSYLANSMGAKFADSCSSISVTNTYHPISPGESEIITFIATDACGNSVSTSATLMIMPCY